MNKRRTEEEEEEEEEEFGWRERRCAHTILERIEHGMAHFPFRSCCWHCVRGRGKVEDVRRATVEERNVSEIHVDCTFVGDEKEGRKDAGALVARGRTTRPVFGTAVPRKPTCERICKGLMAWLREQFAWDERRIADGCRGAKSHGILAPAIPTVQCRSTTIRCSLSLVVRLEVIVGIVHPSGHGSPISQDSCCRCSRSAKTERRHLSVLQASRRNCREWCLRNKTFRKEGVPEAAQNAHLNLGGWRVLGHQRDHPRKASWEREREVWQCDLRDLRDQSGTNWRRSDGTEIVWA